MMKSYLTICALSLCVVFTTQISGQSSCVVDRITLFTQAQVDSFPTNYPGYSYFDTDILISGPEGSITNLDSLIQIEWISGFLWIMENDSLSSLEGLDSLKSVMDWIDIRDNNALQDLTGLNNLTYIGNDLWISQNAHLRSFEGLSNLHEIGDELRIGDFYGAAPQRPCCGNPILSSLTGLERLEKCSEIQIMDNPQLTDLHGLEGLTQLNRLYLGKNDSLTDLSGLDNLSYVGSLHIENNSNLATLDGLNNVLGTKSIRIIKSNGLKDFRALANMRPASLTYLEIILNDSLETLNGLQQIKEVNGKAIVGGNPLLTDISGLGNIERVYGDLSIGMFHESWQTVHGNASLNQLGLERLEAVYGTLEITGNSIQNLEGIGRLRIVENLRIRRNDSLVSLDGLDLLEYIGSVSIRGNPLLAHCSTQPICEYLEREDLTAFFDGNSAGCNTEVEVSDACDLVLSTTDIAQSEITVYPNPTSGIVTIQDQSNRDIEVRCYSLDGTHINSSRLGMVNQIDLSNFSDGIYILEVDDDGQRQSFRVVKQ